jgi:hypothetical protein
VLDLANGGLDTGLLPPLNSPLAADAGDIQPRFASGISGTLGYHWDNCAIEASGFYIFQNQASRLYTAPGMLDSLFNVNGDFNSFPLGFEGDNGMWLQADIMRIELKTAIASGEVNFRSWPGTDSNVSWSLGVRYLGVYERFSFFTGDDDLTVRTINGFPDPTRQATYTATANNNIIAPQVGLEWNLPLCCWLAFSLQAKGAWGIDCIDVDTLLKRGDGFIGFSGHRTNYTFSQVYQTGLFLDFPLAERGRVRLGWQALFVVNVADAVTQLDYNLADQAAQGGNNHGNIFYQGPVVELHLLF